MRTFTNLAGIKDCDDTIKKELSEAGVAQKDRIVRYTGEVKSKIFAHHHGWIFERAWYYWVVYTKTTPLLFEFASELHKEHKTVRVNGHCGSPSPKDEFSNIWDIGVNLYHIDTQEGLNAFVDYVEQQTQAIE